MVLITLHDSNVDLKNSEHEYDATISCNAIYVMVLCWQAQTENDEGINPEPCPICQRELGVEVCLLCLNVIRNSC